MPEPSDAPAPADDPAASALEQAHSLLAGGNYAAAREAVDRAIAAGAGAEAEDLRAQIGLAEQAAALKLYDAALAAVREQEYDRARAMLNEVAAMPSALDASMAQRVQDLLIKLPSGGAAAPAAGLDAQLDAMTIKAQRLNAEVGTKVAEARRLMEVEPDQAIALLEETRAAVEAAELSDAGRPDDGPPRSRSPSSWPRRTRSPSTPRWPTRRPAPRSSGRSSGSWRPTPPSRPRSRR